ncbi:MAG: tetratricopeptide repeat protein [Gemmatimonadaceae bacterium]|nr:tetratricopeptide repeat protein [Gemmatimonadaceae bacterium]
MANVAALKKKAADFEAKKQTDKAIAAYREILDAYDRGEDTEPEIALYNRVGDLLARQGNTAEAVVLYERAVDLYSEGGFFNNAIALCNKVLRTSPGRASIYYKLGKISAAKGFKAEAKQNFIEYADRMQKGGQLDEAFRALKEFAELVPDQDDVRLTLAEQLTKAGKQSEALEQLQVLYNRHSAAGRDDEAAATLTRIRAIDPAFEPQASEASTASRNDGLVFIDLDAPPRRTTRTMRVQPPPLSPQPVAPPASAPVEATLEPERIEPVAADATQPTGTMAGLELTSASDGSDSIAPPADTGSLLGLEPTSLGTGGDAVAAEQAPLDAAEFGAIDLSTIEEAKPERPAEAKDLALGGDLPLIGGDAARDSGSLLALDDATLALGGGGDATSVAAEAVVQAPADLGVEPTALDAVPADEAPLDLIVVDTDDEPSAAMPVVEPAVPDAPTQYHEVEAEAVEEAPPPVRRSSAIVAANSVMALRVKVAEAPEDWHLRRSLAEALLEDGERDEGLRELEAALAGFDRANDVGNASSVADEIVRVDPSSVRYHQKRVEYAFRANDKGRTADAYLSLADALLRNGQSDRARTVYERVLEIRPNDPRAVAAIEALTPAVPPDEAAQGGRTATPPRGRRYTGAIEAEKPTVKATPEAPTPGGDDDFVSLGDWLREDEGPKSTRMVVEEQEPTGDEQADFADMLKKFKQGISENVEEEDHESHYDLGVAYKEMGLIDEAIAEFQKALRGTEHRARTYEALGQCFLEKKQLPVATTILKRALSEPGVGDEQLVGVLYLLGYIHESQQKPADAKGFYERVFSVDIQFRDVGERLNAVDKALK